MAKFSIPAAVSDKPKRTEPGSLIVYSAPKVGKSALAALFPNSVTVEHEVGGADALRIRMVEVFNPNNVLPFLEQAATDDSFDTLIVDTVTKWDEWSELVGTYDFMKKPQGKKFNVVNDKKVNHKHESWDTVHSIGEGYGYRYSREVMLRWYKAAIATGKRVIFLAHIKDKFIESKSGDVVEAIDLNLTGKVKSIYSANVDAIAHLKRSGNKSHLSFQNLGDTVSGCRYPYLQGSILIGESDEQGVLTAYWENIFPSLKK